MGWIILNRPEKMNALSPELIRELVEKFTLAESDREVKVIILKGEGKAFCAGADLQYLQKLQQFTYEENLKDSLALKDLFLKIHQMKKVVIAQVQGPALAGGCGLASICDFILASKESSFGFTEVRIGFVPALVMVFMLMKCNEGWVRKWMLSGKIYPAEEALKVGLVEAVFPGDRLEEEVKNFATRLLEGNSATSMGLVKEMLWTLGDKKGVEALQYAAKMNARARGTEDCQRGISAFLKKEKIKW